MSEWQDIVNANPGWSTNEYNQALQEFQYNQEVQRRRDSAPTRSYPDPNGDRNATIQVRPTYKKIKETIAREQMERAFEKQNPEGPMGPRIEEWASDPNGMVANALFPGVAMFGGEMLGMQLIDNAIGRNTPFTYTNPFTKVPYFQQLQRAPVMTGATRRLLPRIIGATPLSMAAMEGGMQAQQEGNTRYHHDLNAPRNALTPKAQEHLLNYTQMKPWPSTHGARVGNSFSAGTALNEAARGILGPLFDAPGMGGPQGGSIFGGRTDAQIAAREDQKMEDEYQKGTFFERNIKDAFPGSLIRVPTRREFSRRKYGGLPRDLEFRAMPK